ncbi:MAG: transposase [Nitrososphaeria archaeon]
MEVTLSVPFEYEANSGTEKLLRDFRDMINFCIEYALKNNITSYARLRKSVYQEWKLRWDYSTHFCHSACLVATSMLKGWRRLKRKGVAKGEKPIAKKLFIRFDPQLVKFEGDRLRISIKSRKFLYIQLKFGDYQKKFIEGWKNGELKVGEVFMNGTRVLIPFRKDVDLSNPSDWIAIDVNESNVTAVSTNPHAIQFKTNLREIRSTYFEKRRRIQRLGKNNPLTSKRLMEKYSRREKNRVKDLCHKLSKSMVDFAKQHGFGIVLEDLKNMRRRINYSKRMNRRLHSLPYRKIQFYIEYKANLSGLPVEYVDAKFSSSLCPICGGRLASNGHRILKCKACGFEEDRDVIACLNLLKRNPRCGGSPLPQKATHEAFKAEVERIVIKS